VSKRTRKSFQKPKRRRRQKEGKDGGQKENRIKKTGTAVNIDRKEGSGEANKIQRKSKTDKRGGKKKGGRARKKTL